jgi:hypothetical protein
MLSVPLACVMRLLKCAAAASRGIYCHDVICTVHGRQSRGSVLTTPASPGTTLPPPTLVGMSIAEAQKQAAEATAALQKPAPSLDPGTYTYTSQLARFRCERRSYVCFLSACADQWLSLLCGPCARACVCAVQLPRPTVARMRRAQRPTRRMPRTLGLVSKE